MMSNVKQVSVREVQHHLARVLALVQDGEEIEITRRDAVVARIIPATGRRGVLESAARPDYHERLKAIYGSAVPGGAGAADEILRSRSRDD
jgi:antitoxin (DNA-binding transcriptional repressor) of toxin-antitoxin stability system